MMMMMIVVEEIIPSLPFHTFWNFFFFLVTPFDILMHLLILPLLKLFFTGLVVLESRGREGRGMGEKSLSIHLQPSLYQG